MKFKDLLSGFVRLYQALDVAAVPVKLDLYEGMIHNFQDRIPDAPEAIMARRKTWDVPTSIPGSLTENSYGRPHLTSVKIPKYQYIALGFAAWREMW